MASPGVARFARHSRFSQPGAHAAALATVPPDPASVSQVCCNLIAHYRGQAQVLPESTRTDIHLRTVAARLTLDAERFDGAPLGTVRPEPERQQGCCRDHTLLAVAILREHGVPARSVVGFAGYFAADWWVDHVIAEWHDGERWVRLDPEVAGEPVPYLTAAAARLAHRREGRDLSTFGVPGVPFLAGAEFVRDYVFFQLAHRQGDELLLWDQWGAIGGIDGDTTGAQTDELADEVATLLLAADTNAGTQAGEAAEQELAERYAADERLHPGPEVLRHDPFEGPAVRETLPRATASSPA